MPLNPELERMLANRIPLRGSDPQTARDMFKQASLLAQQSFPPPAVKVHDHTIPSRSGSVRVRRYDPDTVLLNHPVVFFHGGGFVLGDLDTHHGIAARLTKALGAIVISVDYARAPEAKFPIPVLQVYDVAAWVSEHASEWNLSPAVIVAGDSAGGNFSAVIAQMARDDQRFPVKAQLLYYPSVNAIAQTASKKAFATGFFLEQEDMVWFAMQYANTIEDGINPLVSPALHPNLAGLPPALVATAEYDPLRDEGEDYAHALKAAGVPVTLIRYDGMTHGFLGFPLPDVLTRAFRDTAEFVRSLE